MEKEVILRIQDVSKMYQLGTFGTNTIGGDINRWWVTKILKKEDPNLQVGLTNNRTSYAKGDFIWALKDINLEVYKGDIIGVIGNNGAGKSTLLKLLSRITTPTTGIIESWGRMASLLEVGTGFHPELTGRENIFLNGAILGMTKNEIQTKLEEIIEFSGCRLFIDTPVKRYSSGMKVRLGFAVAAFLDPEILIVDEVLAVGDISFQERALGRLKEINHNQNRTVIFVSHNMGVLRQLCKTGILIENGKITKTGLIDEVVDAYLGASQVRDNGIYFYKELNRTKTCGFKEIGIYSKLSHSRKNILFHDEGIMVTFDLFGELLNLDYNIFFTVVDVNGVRVASFESGLIRNCQIKCVIEPNTLVRGMYSIHAFIHKPQVDRLDEVENVCSFQVLDNNSPFNKHKEYDYGRTFLPHQWI